MVNKPEEVEEESESFKDDAKSIGKDLLEHIYNTSSERLPEMTILRQRLIHGLTTMQAWEMEFLEIVKQIRRYQAWFSLQKTRKAGKYDADRAKELYDKLVKEDKIDISEMFSHSWRNSLYQHARSEDGKQLEGARQLEEGIISATQTEADTQWGKDQ